MNKILAQKLKKIPHQSGVYFFKNSENRIIYIGKAIDIKKRVQQHFSKKTAIYGVPFIDNVVDLDWIKTNNEKQALILENELIKKYKPRYNIQWRDDKSYFWVKFTEEEWPRIIISHMLKVKAASLVNGQGSMEKNQKRETQDQTGRQDQKLKPIGPFVSGRELKKTLRVLRKILPFRTCKNPYNKPCLQWHLGLCFAHKPNSKFKVQSSKLQFKVQNYKNLLITLSQFLRLYAGEKIRIEAYDISNIQGKYATGSMIVFRGDKPSKNDYRKFRIKTVRGANDVAMIKEIIRRRLNHREWPYPDLILIDGGKPQLNAAGLEIGNWPALGRAEARPGKLEIPLFALAKRVDEVYTEYSPKSLKISQLPESLRRTLQRIRDEAHRFAIFYYRYLHEKRGFGKSRAEIRKARKHPKKT